MFDVAFFFAEFTVGPMWAIPMDIAPKFSGSASGLMNTGSALAAILSPLIFGFIIDKTGNWGAALHRQHRPAADWSLNVAFRMKPDRGSTDRRRFATPIWRPGNLGTLHTMQPLPLSSHAKPVDSFPKHPNWKELKRSVRGEVRFDRGSRALYATDGSNYRQIPIGLVVPRDADDVIAAVAVCNKYEAPILPRGAGTSLAGQCCNVAVVLDFTKYMNQILEIDPDAAIRASTAWRCPRYAS